MNNSEVLYKELIQFGTQRIREYFKNVPLYDTQFNYTELNHQCFNTMYSKVEPGDVYPTRKHYFQEVPDLESECKQCWKYYLKPRNKFIKGYDVQLAKLLEEIMIGYLKTKGITVIRADLKNRKYPDLLVLDDTRAIQGYMELKYHAAPFVLTYKLRPGRECYEGSLTLDKEKIIKQLRIIYSELDRPVYFVNWVDFPCLKGIFYQTSEELSAKLLANTDEFYRKHREGDFLEKKDGTIKKIGYTEKIYPSILEMRNFEELIKNIGKK